MLPTVLLFSVIFTAPAAAGFNNHIPLHPAENWHVDVGPGEITFDGDTISLADPVRLVVPPPQPIVVTGEQTTLPIFNEKAGGWMKGIRLKALITQECSATGLLRPETVVVRSANDGTRYTVDKDYAMDALWATVGRLEGGAIGENDRVTIDYTYGPSRLDAIVVNKAGQVRLIPGQPGLGLDAPPVTGPDEVHMASVWIPGNTQELTQENLFPVEGPQDNATQPEHRTAAQLLPRTLAKLQSGEPVTIVAWGDSVTAGGGVGADTEAWYQNQFLARLKVRFPNSDITLITAAWPGRGSRNYLESPSGSDYDFERDVLAQKPDLVTCEWVNDAYLKGDALDAQYGLIVQKLRGAGAEVVLLTPHLVRPDWMGVTTLKFDDDPRPYVQGLRAFANANDVALADGAARWCGLWRQGIPYTTLLSNSINHPNAQGHGLLADALMALFPS